MTKECLKRMKPTAATLTKSNFDILTGRTEEHLVALGEFLIHELVKDEFVKLQELAKKEINADLNIISSFRSFERQQMIWNAKARAQRIIKNDAGEELDINKLSPKELLLAIMRFSAIPGNSRHHWGTDIDIFDANEMDKKDVSLEAWECEMDGPFYKLHSWLNEKIKLNQCFGFYRPYDEDRGGVSVEKWHLSYKPIAGEYFKSYTLEVFQKNISDSEMDLKSKILEDASSYFEKFFLTINK